MNLTQLTAGSDAAVNSPCRLDIPRADPTPNRRVAGCAVASVRVSLKYDHSVPAHFRYNHVPRIVNISPSRLGAMYTNFGSFVNKKNTGM